MFRQLFQQYLIHYIIISLVTAHFLKYNLYVHCQLARERGWRVIWPPPVAETKRRQSECINKKNGFTAVEKFDFIKPNKREFDK